MNRRRSEVRLPEWLDASWFRSFRSRIRSWYARHGRSLPWQGDRDAYRVWLSEIMLQQTTVSAVEPYYRRFLDQFPTVEALAAADEAAVLKQWEGLGYYSRARNLHRAARTVSEQWDGQFREDPAELETLPGVGRYTAGAIASFAFNQPAPIVEANTLRLYARLLGMSLDPRSAAGQRQLWGLAERLVQTSQPAVINQALMDLGSEVCTPVGPACERCPVNDLCAAVRDGTQDEIPVRPRRPRPTEVIDAAVVLRRKTRFFLRRRGPDERWRGLWDFPRLTLEASPGSGWILDEESRSLPASSSEWESYTRSWLIRNGFPHPAGITRCGEMRHTVTRYRIRLIIYEADCTTGSPTADDGEQGWFTVQQIEELPLSKTGRKIAQQVFRSSGSAHNGTAG